MLNALRALWGPIALMCLAAAVWICALVFTNIQDDRSCALHPVAEDTFIILSARNTYCSPRASGRALQNYLALHPDVKVESYTKEAVVLKQRNSVL